ncbi:hypothetical protein [Vibrio thalassae]|nr:hypothetical protein [Vibrio thalassae]
MKSFVYINASTEDEVEFFTEKVVDYFGAGELSEEFERLRLRGKVEQLNQVIARNFDSHTAVLLANKWKIEYQTEIDPDHEPMAWINTSRVSGFCFMMIDFQKRDFMRYLSSMDGEPLSKLKARTQQYANPLDANTRSPRDRRSLNTYRSKSPDCSYAEKIKQEKINEGTAVRVDKIVIDSTPKNPLEFPASSSISSHKERLRLISKYLNDASEETRGELALDALELLINLKINWQNVYLSNNTTEWIDRKNERQLKWIIEILKKEERERFVLPWLATSIDTLYESIITYFDIQWHYDNQSAKNLSAKLKKAWLRKISNEEKNGNSINLRMSSYAQLVELERALSKSSKNIVKDLISQKHREIFEQ